MTDQELYSKEYAHIRVIPIDMKRFNADLDKQIKVELEKGKESAMVPKLRENEEFYINKHLALIVGTNMLTEDDCVADLLENLETAILTFDVYAQIRVDCKVKEFGIFPKFTSKMAVGEMLKDYSLPETSLETFMGNNFWGGRRIRANMAEIAEEYDYQTGRKQRPVKTKRKK